MGHAEHLQVAYWQVCNDRNEQLQGNGFDKDPEHGENPEAYSWVQSEN
ncbi:protein of unknown function [Citrobacter amalonaticus]|uniref:Uncharacterized protein n=1 Tax=Citrobacter amalonaticus TaxID=35703 RepID=A0AAX2BH40_CITAM|nr:protein of unknown function [Citrobacter amalonaticus]SBA09810.1 protein of unknown function [Citrobacter amalonaticus]